MHHFPKPPKLKDKLLDIELEIRDAVKGRLKNNESDIIEHISKRTSKQRIGPLEDSNDSVPTNDPKNSIQNQTKRGQLCEFLQTRATRARNFAVFVLNLMYGFGYVAVNATFLTIAPLDMYRLS